MQYICGAVKHEAIYNDEYGYDNCCREYFGETCMQYVFSPSFFVRMGKILFKYNI